MMALKGILNCLRPLPCVINPSKKLGGQRLDHRGKGIIRARRLPEEPDLRSPVIMVVFPYMLQRLIETHDLHEYKFKDGLIERIWIRPCADGTNMGIIGPFVGAPQAALGVEKLAVMGVKEVFVLGCCGAISQELSIGDIFLPHSALSEEGVSRIYLGEQLVFLPSKEAEEKMKTYIRRANLNYKTGAIFTTDGVLMETRSKLQAYERLGIKAVDMEISAIFCVAMIRNLKAAGAFVVSDELYHDSWKPGFSSKEFKEHSYLLTKAIYEGILKDEPVGL